MDWDVPPCHKLPRAEWCDRDGLGGFMGHTCFPPTKIDVLDHGFVRLVDHMGGDP